MTNSLKQNDLVCYKTLPLWMAEKLPEMFREQHNTQAGTWAKLHIQQGAIRVFMLDETGNVLSQHDFDSDHQPDFIAPQVWHRVDPLSDDLLCQLSFYCERADYVTKRHNLTRTHSEVLAAAEIIPAGKALDLGCGRGRNSLYLAKLGFDVTAVDANAMSVDLLRQAAEKDGLAINASTYDINTAAISDNYDFILSTVVMMFLDPTRIDAIVENMQAHTNVGGYNLIVVALDTDDYPCNVGFSSPLKSGQLEGYYKDWEILKYNENIGELHRLDANGNRIKLRFATLLAKKSK